MNNYIDNLYFGVIRLFRQPQKSLVLMLTLGFTLAALMSVFAVYSGLILKPLAGIEDESNLSSLQYNFKLSDEVVVPFWSMKRLYSFQKRFDEYGEWALESSQNKELIIERNSVKVTHVTASSNIFSVLRTSILRGVQPNDNNTQDAIWISKSLWKDVFDEDNEIFNNPTLIDNKLVLVVGVVEDVHALKSDESILSRQIWSLTNLKNANLEQSESGSLEARFASALVREKASNLSLPSLDNIDKWRQTYLLQNMESNSAKGFNTFINSLPIEYKVESYRDYILGNTKLLISLSLLAVIALVIIAVSNLINVFLISYQSSSKNYALKIVCGSKVNKIRIGVFFENLPLFIISTILGFILLFWFIQYFPVLAEGDLPLIASVSSDPITVTIGIIIMLSICIIFSLPALITTDLNILINNLKNSGKGASNQRSELMSKLVLTFQLALSVLLLVSLMSLANYSYKSVYKDLGFTITNTQRITVSIPQDYVQDFEAKGDTLGFRDVFSMLRHSIQTKFSNVDIVATTGPLSNDFSAQIYNPPENPTQSIMYKKTFVDEEYFSYFNIPVIEGHSISAQEISVDKNVILIDENMMKILFPQQKPSSIIGKQIKLSGLGEGYFTVIGVTSNVADRALQGEFQLPTIYHHEASLINNKLIFLVRDSTFSKTEKTKLVNAIKDAFPYVNDIDIRSIKDEWNRQTLQSWIGLCIVIALALLTVVLTFIGVFSLTQSMIHNKKYQLAIRMAYGAKQHNVIIEVVSKIAIYALLGISVGIMITLLADSYINNFSSVNIDIDYVSLTISCATISVLLFLSSYVSAYLLSRKNLLNLLKAQE